MTARKYAAAFAFPLSLLLAATLVGCEQAVPTPTASATATPAATATADPVSTPSLILGVQGLTFDDGTGAGLTTVARDHPDAVVGLITQLLGQPTVESTPFGDEYAWNGVSASVSEWATVRFETAEVGGYQLRTAQGISVGASRVDIAALSPFDGEYDGDGDGSSDTLGLEPVAEPGTESLLTPGAVGTSYVDAIFDGDTVVALVAPGGDWRDV